MSHTFSSGSAQHRVPHDHRDNAPDPAKTPEQAANSALGGFVRHIVPMFLREIPRLPVTSAVSPSKKTQEIQ